MREFESQGLINYRDTKEYDYDNCTNCDVPSTSVFHEPYDC